jgi:hypothetical protein
MRGQPVRIQLVIVAHAAQAAFQVHDVIGRTVSLWGSLLVHVHRAGGIEGSAGAVGFVLGSGVDGDDGAIGVGGGGVGLGRVGVFVAGEQVGEEADEARAERLDGWVGLGGGQVLGAEGIGGGQVQVGALETDVQQLLDGPLRFGGAVE